MAIPATINHRFVLLLVVATAAAAAASAATPCAGRVFSRNRVFAACVDLPVLGSALHYTYGAANGEISLAFTGTPPPSARGGGGWVSWGINPDGPRMVGAQAIVGYAKPDGSMEATTWNVSSYRGAAAGVGAAIAYEVDGLEAEGGGTGEVRVFARVRLPAGTGRVNHVWQVGPVDGGGTIGKHAFEKENLMAKGELDLAAGRSVGDAGGEARIRKRNIHGVLNAVGWGILLPVGAIIARYLKTFKSADPAWFYLHVSCQVAGYVVGVAGWGTGLKLGSESKGVQYNTHRSIGIALFCIGTIQMSALFTRPKKNHKYRPYWRAGHLSIGYAVIALGIVNIFKGLEILSPNQKWKVAYITIIAILGCIAAFLEAVTWFLFLKRRHKSMQSDDHNGQKTVNNTT